MLFAQWILLIEKALTIVEVHAEQIGEAPLFGTKLYVST